MCDKLNIDFKIAQIDAVLNEANKRALTLFGKVIIIKSLAIAKIIFTAMCLPISDHVVKLIDQKIFRYLWGKRDRIKRKVVVNRIEAGGLNMIDFKSQ